MHPAVKSQVFRLMAKGVDVSARVLRHDDNARSAGAGFGPTGSVVPMEEIVEAGCMGRMGGCPGISRLLEIEDASGAQRARDAGVVQSQCPAPKVRPKCQGLRCAPPVAPFGLLRLS